MADSLVVANVIELMMGDQGPVLSTIPGLENTTFALDDQNADFSLGVPQPTVDILASLITDGERPQGRRASNRTVSIPIAILSDTRDNLSYAREMVFSLADQEQFTTRYLRDGSTTGPMILDCWRAEPADVTYAPVVESQFACQLVLNFQALPYGHSDTPNTISFKSPAAGTAAPPGPILLDGFSTVQPGWPIPWQVSPVCIAGDSSLVTVAGGNVSNAFYQFNFPGLVDFTSGGLGLNNVLQLWCGFASQRYYNNWSNHRSEVTFSLKLFDVNGNSVNGMSHGTVEHSNNLGSPKWTHVSCRMPTSKDFDYTRCTGYQIRCHNYITGGNPFLRDSTLFLCQLNAVSPSSSVQNQTRGSIYQVNGVEGSVHTALNIAATQKPGTNVVTTNFNGTGLTGVIPPSGVISTSVAAIAPGGPGGPTSAFNAGGGGGERCLNSNIPLTPGSNYQVSAPVAQPPLLSAPFSGTWTTCGTWNTAAATTGATTAFSAGAALGSSVFFEVVLPASPVAFNGSLTVTDNAGGTNTYAQIASSAAPDGTLTAIFARFNIQTAITTSNTFTVSMTPTQIGASVVASYTNGLMSCLPMTPNAGSGASAYISDGKWVDAVNSEPGNGAVNTTFWTPSACTLAVNAAAPAGGLSAQSLQLSSTAASGTAGITSGPIAVDASAPVLLDMLAYLTAGSSRSVTIGYAWLNAAGGTISSSSFSVTYVAGSWKIASTLSGWTSPFAPPSGALSITYSVTWSPSAIGETLDIQLAGPRLASNDNPVYLAIAGNNSALATSATPPGWTHVNSGANSANLASDLFYVATHGIGGGLFGSPALYVSAVPWAAAIVRLSDSAGWAGLIGDGGVGVIAHGGQPASSAANAGGLGGIGSNSPVHSPGGNGANAPGAAGGGGGSSGGNSTITTVDDTDTSLTWWAASAPPVQMTGDWNSSSFVSEMFAHHGFFGFSGNENVILNGAVINDPQMTQRDTVFLAIVSTAAIPVISPRDSNGNNYTLLDSATMPGNTWQAQLFYANASNNGGAMSLLSAGDTIWVDPGSSTNFEDYAIMAYVMKDAATIQGTSHGAAGEAEGTFTGTTGAATLSSLTTPPNGHFGITIATDGNKTSLDAAPLKHNVGNAQFVRNFPAGDLLVNWPFSNGVMQAFWKDADTNGTATSSALAFSRTVSGAVSYLFTTLHADTTAWTTGANASYRGGTSHIATRAGKHCKITATATQIQVVGKKGPDQGIMYVSVDNGAYVVADNYRSVAQYQSVLFDTGTLSSGSHTIDIISAGTHNPSSTNYLIDIDGYNTVASGPGAGSNGSGSTGGTAATGGGAGGNGATSAGNGSAGGAPGGGGGGPDGAHVGGNGGQGQVILQYTGVEPTFKTLVLHRPFIDGSKTLLPYIACQSQAVPTSDIVQGIFPNVPPHFQGTYSFVVVGTFNSPASARTVTVTVTEYENAPGGVLPAATATSAVAKSFIPNDPIPLGAPNGIITIGELSLPNKDIPPENNQAVYKVVVSSSNPSDTIQDILILDTMGQTVEINESTGYSTFFVDEPTPDRDIGRIMGSQYDRPYAISVLDSAFPSGGPLTVEPGDNILFAYCVEGAPALSAWYFPRFFIDRTAS